MYRKEKTCMNHQISYGLSRWQPFGLVPWFLLMPSVSFLPLSIPFPFPTLVLVSFRVFLPPLSPVITWVTAIRCRWCVRFRITVNFWRFCFCFWWAIRLRRIVSSLFLLSSFRRLLMLSPRPSFVTIIRSVSNSLQFGIFLLLWPYKNHLISWKWNKEESIWRANWLACSKKLPSILKVN